MADQPRRIQRRRTQGWRMPAGAIYVGRPSRWGNPFTVDGRRIIGPAGNELWSPFDTREAAVAHAVRAFGWQLDNHPNVVGFTVDDVRSHLAGRDLACWCPLDQPCHADVLLRVANQ